MGTGEKRGETKTGARSKRKIRSIRMYMGKSLLSSRDNWAKSDEIGMIRNLVRLNHLDV